MLNHEEIITNADTLTHIRKVSKNIHIFVKELLDRADIHDDSKLEQPEVGILAKAPKLEGLTYGNKDYEASKDAIKDALEHHYARNRHHPEHFKNGINDMTLVDLIELFCDWKSSSERHNNGNILKSIEVNGRRFAISEQLVRIFENTAREMY